VDFRDVDGGQSRKLIEYLDFGTRFSPEQKAKTFAAQRLAAGMHVLDVGCGTGDDVRAIAQIVGPGGSAVGVDASQAMIDEATARGLPPNAAFHRAEACALPFEDAAFDAARADRLFQHLEDPAGAAREIGRVLKPQGTLLLLDQDWGSLMISGARQDVTQAIVASFAATLANPFAGRAARGLLAGAGFRDVGFLPVVSVPPLPIAFESILKPAMDAAARAGDVDAKTAGEWLAALLDADRRGAFFCAVVVIVALGRRACGDREEAR